MDGTTVHRASGSAEKSTRLAGAQPRLERRSSGSSLAVLSPHPFPSLARSVVIPSADAALHSKALDVSLPFHSCSPPPDSSPFTSSAPAPTGYAVAYCCLSYSEKRDRTANARPRSLLSSCGWVGGLLHRAAEATAWFYEPSFYPLPSSSYERRPRDAPRLLTSFLRSITSVFSSLSRLVSSVCSLFETALLTPVYPGAVALAAATDLGGSSKAVLLAADGAHSERSCLLDGDGALLLTSVPLSPVSPVSEQLGLLFTDTAEGSGPRKCGIDSLLLLGHVDASSLLRYSGKAFALESALGCAKPTACSAEEDTGWQGKELVLRSARACSSDSRLTDQMSAQLGRIVRGSSRVSAVALLPHGTSVVLLFVGYTDGRLECVCHRGSARSLEPSPCGLHFLSPLASISSGSERGSEFFKDWALLWTDILDASVICLRVSPRGKRVCVLTTRSVFVFDPLMVLGGCPPPSSTKLSCLFAIGGEALLGHSPLTCCWTDEFQLVILCTAGRLTLLQRDPRRKAADLSCVCRARLDSQTRAVLRRQLWKSSCRDKRSFSKKSNNGSLLSAVVPLVTMEFHQQRRLLYIAVRGDSRLAVVDWQMRPRPGSIRGGRSAASRVLRLLFGRHTVLETVLAALGLPGRGFVVEGKSGTGLAAKTDGQPRRTDGVRQEGGPGLMKHARCCCWQATMIPRRPVLRGVLTFALGRDSHNQDSYLAVIHDECEAVAVYHDSSPAGMMRLTAQQAYNLEPHRACLSFWLTPPFAGCCPSAVAFCSFPSHCSESYNSPKAPVLLVQWSLLSNPVVAARTEAAYTTPAVTCVYRLPASPPSLQTAASARWAPFAAAGGGCSLPPPAGSASLFPPRGATDAELETYKTWREASSLPLSSWGSIGDQSLRDTDLSWSRGTEGEVLPQGFGGVQRSDAFSCEPNASFNFDDTVGVDRTTALGKSVALGTGPGENWRPARSRAAWQPLGTPSNILDSSLSVSALKAEPSLRDISWYSDSTLKPLFPQRSSPASPSYMSDWLVRWKLKQQRLAESWRPSPEGRYVEIPPAVPSPSFSRWAFPHRVSRGRASPYGAYPPERNTSSFGMHVPNKESMWRAVSYPEGRQYHTSLPSPPSSWWNRTGNGLSASSGLVHEQHTKCGGPTACSSLFGQPSLGTAFGASAAGVGSSRRTRLSEFTAPILQRRKCPEDCVETSVAGGGEVPQELSYGLGQSVGAFYPPSSSFTAHRQPPESDLTAAQLPSTGPLTPVSSAVIREIPVGCGESLWKRRNEAAAGVARIGLTDRW